LVSADSLYSAPLLNWLLSTAILRWHNPNSDDMVSQHAADLDAYIALGTEQARSDPSFWNAVIVPDCLMVRYLADPARTEVAIRAISEAYRKARDEGASEREVQTVVEHLDFLVAMARALRPGDPLAVSLERCRDYLLAEQPAWPKAASSPEPATARVRSKGERDAKKPVHRKAAKGTRGR
jgi:hypothetical protein